MIMLMQLHCIYFWFIGNHTLCKLHVYYTHKDTKQYWFGPFILYTCTMYLEKDFSNLPFYYNVHFSNLRDWNKITVCILKCR